MKRFYKDVTCEEVDSGWRVLLDGRGIKTPGGRTQIVPTLALAEALAEEWHSQENEIDPARFVLRDQADFAIDVVAPAREESIRELLGYAETDTLCYRGEEGDTLHGRQVEVWEPLLLAAEKRWDIHFERVSGIIHRPQPQETLVRLEAVLLAQDDFALAALRTLASLTASLVIALAAIESRADPESLWDAASLEEDWQTELWGKDAEAELRRARRFTAFAEAMRFAALAQSAP